MRPVCLLNPATRWWRHVSKSPCGDETMTWSGRLSMRGRTTLTLVMLASFAAASSRAAAMQGGTAAPTNGATPVAVTGTVYDSIAHAPLEGANVQLVDPEHASRAYNAMTDAHGAFAIPSVTPGRYAIGFYHPSLEALGIQPPLTGIDVESGHPASILLTVPGASRIAEIVCGARTPSDSSGALVGMVRDADSGAPLAGATVAATWWETRIVAHGIQQLKRRVP